LWCFLGIAVLLFMSKDIPQGGPAQWGWISMFKEKFEPPGIGAGPVIIVTGVPRDAEDVKTIERQKALTHDRV
jgi:hypothetical protein